MNEWFYWYGNGDISIELNECRVLFCCLPVYLVPHRALGCVMVSVLRLSISVRLYIPSPYYPHAKSYTPSIFIALSKSFPIQISTCFVLCICVIRPGIEKRQRKYELVEWDMQKEKNEWSFRWKFSFVTHSYTYIQKLLSFLSILQNRARPTIPI